MFDFIDIVIKGGPVMVPLLACSIIALTVVIERWLYWRRIGDRQLAETLLELVERGELSKARRIDATSRCAIGARDGVRFDAPQCRHQSP